ncbi:MAG: hypothetical protein U0800_16310 [Isosphaeraceae bacterium]
MRRMDLFAHPAIFFTLVVIAGSGPRAFAQLPDGAIIRLENQGALEDPQGRWLDGRTRDGTVGLLGNPNVSGTRWRVRDFGNGIIGLENQGANEAPQGRWLDGRTRDGTVGLLGNPSVSGTRWRVHRL